MPQRVSAVSCQGAHNPKVAGSNPAPATNRIREGPGQRSGPSSLTVRPPVQAVFRRGFPRRSAVPLAGRGEGLASRSVAVAATVAVAKSATSYRAGPYGGSGWALLLRRLGGHTEMQEPEARHAVSAAISTASALDLAVDDAVVLSDSDRLVVRLTPCDVVARVTPMTHHASAEREVELVRRLAQTDSPVARSRLGPSHASSCVKASRSPCGPISNLRSIEYFRRPNTRRCSSVFMPACGRSTSRRRTSWIASRLFNETRRVVTSLPISPMRTGRSSPTRCAF